MLKRKPYTPSLFFSLKFKEFRNLYTIRGIQIKKLAKPNIKNVGIIFSVSKFSDQIRISADEAHKIIKNQNNLSVIFSTISLYNNMGR